MNVGLDIGRGNLKLVSMDKSIKFESYCGEARELDYYNADDKYIIKIDDKEYFVGDIAKREGYIKSFQKHKIDEERTLPLALTALYLCSDKDNVDVNIVCGTPLSDYNIQKLAIEEYLKGSYKVAIKNNPIKYITIRNVKVFPEGAGSYFSMVLNNEGKGINSEITKSKVGIIDIGYKTTNIVVFENLKYIDKQSTSFNLGVHQAFNMIYKKLSRTEDINVEQAENIKSGPEFKYLADRIRNEVNKFWGNTSFKIYLSGGGAYLLKDYLYEFDILPYPEYANARGYFKIAQMLYQNEKIVWSI